MPSSKILLSSVLLGVLCAAAPCDIYVAGNTPCVAAHSTTRALYDKYAGPLYQLRRDSDGAQRDIFPRAAGGVADGIEHDRFCFQNTCLISIIYDQSGSNNHLTQAPPGGFNGPDVGGYDNLASAIGAPVKLEGQLAYGVFISPGTGYRINRVNGTAIGDEPQGMYAIFDGTHYNGACCFDYGNAETNNLDTGNGHMEALYFGTSTDWGFGSGSGPWVMADLENGLFSGADPKLNAANPSIKNIRFLTSVLKGKPGRWALRAGDATVRNGLQTFYDGARPSVEGYDPMSKEGAIVLGIGGDNSNGAQGTFYEGVLTTGYPTDATENAVQANIFSKRYTVARSGSGAQFTINQTASFRATTPGFTNRYLANEQGRVVSKVINMSDITIRKQATWIVRPGLGFAGCYSLEASDAPGSFLRHFAFGLRVDINDGSKNFAEDATFCRYSALSGTGSSFRSWSYPTRWIRHFDSKGYVASQGGVRVFDNRFSFANDVSWVVLNGIA